MLDAIRAWAAEHGGIPPSATDWNPGHAIALGHPEKAEKFYADDAWPATGTVQKVFGSWNAAIKAAGFAPRRSGMYGRDGEDLDLCREVRARYEAGESTEDLAVAYDCHAQTITHRIKRVGGRMRSNREAQLLRWQRERARL